MSGKKHPIVLFSIFLSLTFAIFFLLHFALLRIYRFDPLGNKIALSYAVNFILAASIYVSLFFLRKRLKNQIGFLFMAGSLLKFVVFFLVFYPVYREDGQMDKLEFASFFIPYALGLVIETIFTAKMLKNLD